MMKKPPRTVGIIGKHSDPSVSGRLAELIGFLEGRNLRVLVEETIAAQRGPSAVTTRPIDTLGKEIDVAIVVGGDGTMLRAARQLAPHRVPIIGINLGRVGFLADIPAQQMVEELGKLLDGHGEVTQRLLLHAKVDRSGSTVHEAFALNEIVITKGELARLIEFETWLDAEFVSAMRADGIIVATPTGSTAYALSAGGPILYPSLPAIAVVPICPHTLSQRPLVVPEASLVEIVMTGTSPATSAHVSIDGQVTFGLETGDRVRVRRADFPVELLHPAGRSHFEVLRTKLHWGRTL